jgi:hypothetical protein
MDCSLALALSIFAWALTLPGSDFQTSLPFFNRFADFAVDVKIDALIVKTLGLFGIHFRLRLLTGQLFDIIVSRLVAGFESQDFLEFLQSLVLIAAVEEIGSIRVQLLDLDRDVFLYLKQKPRDFRVGRIDLFRLLQIFQRLLQIAVVVVFLGLGVNRIARVGLLLNNCFKLFLTLLLSGSISLAFLKVRIASE